MTTVLIAEDEANWMTAIKRVFENDDFDVRSVEDDEGVKEEAPNVEVLVIDVMLGEPLVACRGIAAVGDLLTRGQIRPQVPIVFVSILSETDDLIQTKLTECGIDPDRYNYVQKPFEPEHLVDTIREQLWLRADQRRSDD